MRRLQETLTRLRTLLLACGLLLIIAADCAGQTSEELRIRTLEAAAAKGSLPAQYALGATAEAEGRFPDAVSWYQRAASQGYAVAQLRLAELLDSSRGTTADHAPITAPTPALAGSSKRRSVAIDARLPIFVGPQTRDGFVDVDQGVLDSIDDIEKELRKSRVVSVVAAKERAVITLDVVSRGATSSNGGGSVGIPIGGVSFFLPIGTTGITTVLRVGDYEKPIVIANCDGWRECAEHIAKDIETWVRANRERFTNR